MISIRSRWFAACAVFYLALVTTSAFAADVTYAPGQRIGFVLPEGLAPASRGAPGFQSLDGHVKVIPLELPVAVYASVESALKSGQTLPRELQNAKPEPFDTAAGKGLLSREAAKQGDKTGRVFSMLVPSDLMTAYVTVVAEDDPSSASRFSDDIIKSMLASIALRKEVPVAEQLDLLPFKMTELSNFKTVRTLVPGIAVLLTDGNDDTTDGSPYVVVSIIPGGPSQADERARLADQLAMSIPGVTNTRTMSAEPLRINEMPGYENRIEATSPAGPVTMVQWLRFSSSATLRIVAGTKKEFWEAAFPRFRAVRDGIQPR
jgi:hypothetical protein